MRAAASRLSVSRSSPLILIPSADEEKARNWAIVVCSRTIETPRSGKLPNQPRNSSIVGSRSRVSATSARAPQPGHELPGKEGAENKGQQEKQERNPEDSPLVRKTPDEKAVITDREPFENRVEPFESGAEKGAEGRG